MKIKTIAAALVLALVLLLLLQFSQPAKQEPTRNIETPTPSATAAPSLPAASATPSTTPTATPSATQPATLSATPSTTPPAASASAPQASLQAMFCGNGVCDPNENCDSCVADCGCSKAQYCAQSGVCRDLLACGDRHCSNEEKTAETCCYDCGCGSGKFCNQYTQKCIAPARITEQEIQAAVEAFAKKYGFQVGKYFVKDSNVEKEAVKDVIVYCKGQTEPNGCGGRIVLFGDGEVLEYLFD